MIALEKDIERKLRQMIEAHGGKCVKWVCPGWAGVPDRIILLSYGRIFFVETKRPKNGRLSKIQMLWQKWLTDLGFSYSVVWNERDLAEFHQYVFPEDFRRAKE